MAMQMEKMVDDELVRNVKRSRREQVNDDYGRRVLRMIIETEGKSTARVRMDLENLMLAMLMKKGFDGFVDDYIEARSYMGWYE